VNDWQITLTFKELELAGCAGLRRRLRAMEKGRVYKNGRPDDDVLYKNDIEGALGELAAALVLGLPWEETTGLDKDTGDVGQFQVRSTDWDPNGSLMLYKDDKPDDIFILVTHKIPVFTLRGWAVAGEVKLQEYWQGQWERPCYKVPQWALYTMDKL